MVALLPNQVHGETDKEELDDDDLNNKELPSEFAEQFEDDTYKSDESDDETSAVNWSNRKKASSNLFVENPYGLNTKTGFYVVRMGTAVFLTRIVAQFGKPQMSNYSERLLFGNKVVLELLSHVSNPTDHTVFFDNYFTSYDLLVKLREKGFKATDTLRENRVGKPPLPSSKEPKNSLEVIMKIDWKPKNIFW